MTIVPFPDPPGGVLASGETVTAAVDRYLDSIKTGTTRSSYADTLARLVSRAVTATQPRSSPRTTPR